jgi:hypothetical protein
VRPFFSSSSTTNFLHCAKNSWCNASSSCSRLAALRLSKEKIREIDEDEMPEKRRIDRPKTHTNRTRFLPAVADKEAILPFLHFYLT